MLRKMGDLEESGVFRRALRSQLQRTPLGKRLNLRATGTDPTTGLIIPGSRVRVPPFPPIKSYGLAIRAASSESSF